MASFQQSEPLALPWHLHTESHSQDVFSSALQELRNVRPHLYSAAHYYEVAYLHSNQKKAVIESLKDYSAKALVNAVDHVGTVASQLNECLSLHTANISNVEVRTASITQRLSTCHERTTCEGPRQSQQMRSRRPHYHKHYNPADTIAEKQCVPLLQLSPGKLAEIFRANVGSDSNTLKSLSWYLAFESSSSAAVRSVANATRSTSTEFENKSFSAQGHFFRSLSNGQTPLCNRGSNSAVKNFPMDSHVQHSRLFSLLRRREMFWIFGALPSCMTGYGSFAHWMRYWALWTIWKARNNIMFSQPPLDMHSFFRANLRQFLYDCRKMEDIDVQHLFPLLLDFLDTSKSLRSLMMSDAVDHKEETCMRKNPFASLFGKNRRAKSRSFDLSKH